MRRLRSVGLVSFRIAHHDVGRACELPGVKGGEGRRYAVLDDILAARVVVDVDGDAAQGGDFGGELGEAGVVLSGGGEGGGGQ